MNQQHSVPHRLSTRSSSDLEQDASLPLRAALDEAAGRLAEGQPAAAVAVYKRLLRDNNSLFEAHYGLSMAFLQQGRWSRAEASAARATEISPLAPTGYAALAQALARQNRLPESVAALLKALSLAPECVEMGLALCRTLRERNALDAVTELLEDALTADPKASNVAELLGLARLRQGQAEAAARLFERVLAVQTNLHAIRKLQAEALYQSSRFEEARDQYQRLLAEQPEDVELYGPLASALSHLGCFDAALDVCDRGLVLAPNKDDLRRIKAQALPCLGRGSEVETLFAPVPDSLLSPGAFDLMLPLLEQCLNLPGDLIECGVYKGGLTVAFARRIQGTGKVVHACDTFEGIPEPTEHDNPSMRGRFNDTSLEWVERLWQAAGARDLIVAHKGLFQDTFSQMSDNRYCFAFLDADFYVSMLQALTHVYSRMSPGGWIIVDDYDCGGCEIAGVDEHTCEGCKIAVDEFLADKPERGQFGCIQGLVWGFQKA